MRYLLIVAILSLCGCTQQDRVASGTIHVMRQVRETPTADGGKVVLEESWTETKDQATTKTGFDPAVGAALQAGVGAVSAAARGDYGDAAVKGIAALSLAAAAWQGAKARGADRRADEHKDDAADGWGKFATLATDKGVRV